MGAEGAPGAAGLPGMLGATDSSAAGSGSLQKGQTTGRKFGDTIFFPQAGHISGPEVVSGGLKHIVVPFLLDHLYREMLFGFFTIEKRRKRNKQRTLGLPPTVCCAISALPPRHLPRSFATQPSRERDERSQCQHGNERDNHIDRKVTIDRAPHITRKTSSQRT